MTATGPFGREVADIYKDLKEQIDKRPLRDPEKTEHPVNHMDPNVKEQVIGDLDGLIKKNEERKY